MYAIKMNNDKSLSATIRATIYQHEKNADTLVFLIPSNYDNINFADCKMTLNYRLPSGLDNKEVLEMDPEPYKDYYMYRLPVNSKFTDNYGEIEVRLSAINEYQNTVLHTGSAYLNVVEFKTNPGEGDNSNDDDRINILSNKVAELERSKADNIIYNTADQYLQLVAGGTPIGDQISIDVTCSGDHDEDSDGDDVIDFDKETDEDYNSEFDEVIYF